MKQCDRCKETVADSYRICTKCGGKAFTSQPSAVRTEAMPERREVVVVADPPVGDPMSDPSAYVEELRRRERKADRDLEVEKMRALAEKFKVALSFFGGLCVEYETYFQVGETQYAGLASRFEPFLQLANDLHQKIAAMPEAIGRDREMQVFVDQARRDVRLQSASDFIKGFHQILTDVSARHQRKIDRDQEIDKLRAIAGQCKAALAFFDGLRVEYEAYYQVDETQYAGLANRLEPMLKRADQLHKKISTMPDAIATDREMRAFVDRAKNDVRLDSVKDFTTTFDAVFFVVKQRKELPVKVLAAVLYGLWYAVSGVFKILWAVLQWVFKKRS